MVDKNTKEYKYTDLTTHISMRTNTTFSLLNFAFLRTRELLLSFRRKSRLDSLNTTIFEYSIYLNTFYLRVEQNF